MQPNADLASPRDAGPVVHRVAAAALGRLILAWCLLVPAVSLAAPITRTYDFTVNNIQDTTAGHIAPPVNPATGSITVTFDPALGFIANQTSGITVHALNIPVSSAIAFSYRAANTDELQIGGLDQGTGSLAGGTNDFFLDIFDASGATPFFGNLGYTSPSAPFTSFGPASRADGTVTVEST